MTVSISKWVLYSIFMREGVVAIFNRPCFLNSGNGDLFCVQRQRDRYEKYNEMYMKTAGLYSDHVWAQENDEEKNNMTETVKYHSRDHGFHDIMSQNLADFPPILELKEKKIRTNEKIKERIRKRKKRDHNQNTREKAIAKGRDPLISLNINLDFLAKSGQKNSARRAEELLLRIEALHGEGYYPVKPDRVSYNAVMNAHAISSDVENSVLEIKRLLRRMEDLSDLGNDNVKPNIVSYNTLITSLAQNNKAEEAEQYLIKMEKTYQNGATEIGPNTITFNSCINAYARVKQPQKAEDVLRRMIAISVKASENGNDRQRDDIKANTITFNTVLHAWAVSEKRGSATRAQRLFDHMKKLYQAGNYDVKPDVFSYASVISALAKTGDNHITKNIEVDSSFVERALNLFDEMERLFVAGDEDLRPNAVVFSAVINALARSQRKDSARQAHDLLLKMKNQYCKNEKDDMICYSSLIGAYSRSEEKYAAEFAVELLNHMVNNDLRPNSQTYCSVITALGRHDKAEEAQMILEDMEIMFASGNDDVQPNTIIFNAVIGAWARSSDILKVDKAQSLLQRMEAESAKGSTMNEPDIITYNSVINTAANSFGSRKLKKKAILVAMDNFKKVLFFDNIQQTSITYFLCVKAIRKLRSPGTTHDEILSKVFKLCCRDGLVNQRILTQLEMTCGDKKMKQMMASLGFSPSKSFSLSAKEIPNEWKAHVHDNTVV